MRILLIILASALIGCGTTRPAEPADPRERGVRAMEQGRLGDAVLAFEQLAAAKPHDLGGQRLLAEAYKRKGDFVRAAETWERLLKVEPGDAEGWRRYADVRFALSHCDTAIRAYTTALQGGVKGASLYERLASCELVLKKPKNALQWADSGL